MTSSPKIVRLNKWFANKRYVLVLATTKDNQLRYYPRLAYSYLIYRLGRGQNCRQDRLASVLGIDRGKTVPRALRELESLGLAKKAGAEWTALEPSLDHVSWFAFSRPTTEAWFRRFATYRVYIPSPDSDLDALANGVYWWLNAFAKEGQQPRLLGQAKTGIARNMRIDAKTVRRALRSVTERGLVIDKHGEFELMRPTKVHLALWLDGKVVSAKAKALTYVQLSTANANDAADIEAINRELVKWSDIMAGVGYSAADIKSYWNDAILSERLTCNQLVTLFIYQPLFSTMFHAAESEHKKNSKGGPSVRLLRYKTPPVLDRAREEARHYQ
ncbi:MAG TPA: hypothetical protein VHV55_04865 [Pirellulales bacterium]|jgi:predicted transcriptional regulator|nr:hypothetical protein [Pirellulales bacterium]